jgi:hypothetical protein
MPRKKTEPVPGYKKRNKNDKRVVGSALRRIEFLELRKEGLTYDEIGRRMGVCRITAMNIVRDEMKRLLKDCSETAEEVRGIELARLDGFLVALGEKIKRGDVSAITAAIRLMERRSKLLGLDSAQQVQVSLSDMLSQLQNEVQNED